MVYIISFIFKTQINFGTAYITRSERFFKDPLKFDPTRWQRDEIGEEIIGIFFL